MISFIMSLSFNFFVRVYFITKLLCPTELERIVSFFVNFVSGLFSIPTDGV